MGKSLPPLKEAHGPLARRLECESRDCVPLTRNNHTHPFLSSYLLLGGASLIISDICHVIVFLSSPGRACLYEAVAEAHVQPPRHSLLATTATTTAGKSLKACELAAETVLCVLSAAMVLSTRISLRSCGLAAEVVFHTLSIVLVLRSSLIYQRSWRATRSSGSRPCLHPHYNPLGSTMPSHS